MRPGRDQVLVAPPVVVQEAVPAVTMAATKQPASLALASNRRYETRLIWTQCSIARFLNDSFERRLSVLMVAGRWLSRPDRKPRHRSEHDARCRLLRRLRTV